MLDFYDDFSKRLQLEKLVIGIEEPIEVKGVGEFVAKIDSGNGGFNVIHGEDVYQHGGVIVFKTYTADNQLKQVSKKLLQYINVNIGSGKVEQRPVIELDIKFGDEEYQKIPFSVANRTSNAHKVLICKDFVKDQLDALIDVGGKMLSQKGIEVEYIQEAWSWSQDVEKTKQDAQSGPLHRKIPAKIGLAAGKGLKATANGIKDGAKAVVTAPFKAMGQNIKKKGGFVRYFLGGMQGLGKFTDAAMIGAGEEAKKQADYDDLYDADKKLIMKKTGENINNLLIYKMIDYQGKFYKGITVTKAEEEHFNAFNEGNKLMSKLKEQQQKAQDAQNQQQQQEQKPVQTDQQQADTANVQAQTGTAEEQEEQILESFEQKLARFVLEATMAGVEPGAVNDFSDTPDPNVGTEAKKEEELSETDPRITEYKRICDLYNKNRKNFYVYFVQSAENIKSKSTVFDREVVKANNKHKFPANIVDKFFVFIGEKVLTFRTDTPNVEIKQQFIDKLGYLEEGEQAKTVNNRWAICFGELNQRRIWMSGTDVDIKNDPEAQQKIIKNFNKDEQEILKDFQALVKKWRKNLFLRYQKLDILDTDSLKLLGKALQKEAAKNESVEGEAPKIDLHLKAIQAEGYDSKKLSKEIQNAISIIKDVLSLAKNHKMLGMSDENWESLAQFGYSPNLDGDPDEPVEDVSQEEPAQETGETEEETSEPEAESEATSEPEQEPEQEAEPEATSDAEPESEPEPEEEVTTEEQPEEAPEQEASQEEVTSEPEEAKPEPEKEEQPVSKEEENKKFLDGIQAIINKHVNGQDSSEPEEEPEPEAKAEPESETKEEAKPEPKEEKPVEEPKKKSSAPRKELKRNVGNNTAKRKHKISPEIQAIIDKHLNGVDEEEAEEEIVESSEFLANYFKNLGSDFKGF